MIGSAGNSHTDLGRPRFDDTSPDFPPNSAYPRRVSNRCLSLPTEAEGVMSITALGPSGRKAYYSNYGVEQTTVAAPGGDYYDFPGTDRTERARNLILAPYPKALACEADEIGPGGKPNTPFVVRDCNASRCAYYQYLQGTSMAATHAVGVAALIVSEYGSYNPNRPHGFGMSPRGVKRVLIDSARNTRCPRQNPFVYPGFPDECTAYCAGTDRFPRSQFNGFYGHGIVDALTAVTGY